MTGPKPVADDESRATGAAADPAPRRGGWSDDETTSTLRRLRMGTLGVFVVVAGVLGSVGAVVTQEWRALPSTLLLTAGGGLVVWLSRWLPSPWPGRASTAERRKAFLVILAALFCIVGGALLFRLLTGADA